MSTKVTNREASISIAIILIVYAFLFFFFYMIRALINLKYYILQGINKSKEGKFEIAYLAYLTITTE